MQTRKHHTQQSSKKKHLSPDGLFIITLLVALLLLAMSACSTSDRQATTGSTTRATATEHSSKNTVSSTTETPTTTSQPAIRTDRSFRVKVYFSKATSGANSAQPPTDNVAMAYPVERLAVGSQVGTFAITQLIQGPTRAEQQQGYYSQVQKSLTGPSTCTSPNALGGHDFTLALNKKGTHAEQGTATLQFCRILSSAGIGTDAAIQTEVEDTLKQFNTIHKVIILTNTGHCFGDESGADICLQ